MWDRIHPGDIAEAIRQVLLCLAIFGVWEMTSEQQNALLMAVSAILAVIVRGRTVSHTRIDTIVENKIADRMMPPPSQP